MKLKGEKIIIDRVEVNEKSQYYIRCRRLLINLLLTFFLKPSLTMHHVIIVYHLAPSTQYVDNGMFLKHLHAIHPSNHLFVSHENGLIK